MPELKTAPGWKPPASGRPWWAKLLIGSLATGAGIGCAIAAALGLSSSPARGQEPHVAAAGFTQQQDARQQDEAAWRSRMETKVDEALQRIAHIEGRLDRK